MKRWMTAKTLLDGALVFVFLLLMADRHTGNAVHEWLGLALTCLLFLHIWWNRRWFGALFSGRYSLFRTFRLVLNLFLAAMSLGTLASAVPNSGTLFSFMGFEGSLFCRTVHVFCAHWTFLLAAVHLGLYAYRVFPGSRRHGAENGVYARAGTFTCASFAFYGVYAFPQRELGSVLTMRSAFLFWEEQESFLQCFLEYGAVFFLCAWAAFFLSRLERRGTRGQGASEVSSSS